MKRKIEEKWGYIKSKMETRKMEGKKRKTIIKKIIQKRKRKLEKRRKR